MDTIGAQQPFMQLDQGARGMIYLVIGGAAKFARFAEANAIVPAGPATLATASAGTVPEYYNVAAVCKPLLALTLSESFDRNSSIAITAAVVDLCEPCLQPVLVS